MTTAKAFGLQAIDVVSIDFKSRFDVMDSNNITSIVLYCITSLNLACVLLTVC